MKRNAVIERKTKETDIKIILDLDGTGLADVDTGIPFIDHMFTLLAAHGFFNFQITALGDTEIDFHHTIEDLGICFGDALHNALGEKDGITRYGQSLIPMDEALARVVIDISNRSFLLYEVPLKVAMAGNFDIYLLNRFRCSQ